MDKQIEWAANGGTEPGALGAGTGAVSGLAALGNRTAIVGRIDASTGNAVLHDLLDASLPGETLLVDLSKLDHIDEAGLATLYTARQQARRIGGELIFAGVPEQFRALLGEFTTEDDLPHT